MEDFVKRASNELFKTYAYVSDSMCESKEIKDKVDAMVKDLEKLPKVDCMSCRIDDGMTYWGGKRLSAPIKPASEETDESFSKEVKKETDLL